MTLTEPSSRPLDMSADIAETLLLRFGNQKLCVVEDAKRGFVLYRRITDLENPFFGLDAWRPYWSDDVERQNARFIGEKFPRWIRSLTPQRLAETFGMPPGARGWPTSFNATDEIIELVGEDGGEPKVTATWPILVLTPAWEVTS